MDTNTQNPPANDGFILPVNHPQTTHHQFISHFFETAYQDNQFFVDEGQLYPYVQQLNEKERSQLALASLERLDYQATHVSNTVDRKLAHWQRNSLKVLLNFISEQAFSLSSEELIQYLNYLSQAYQQSAILRTELPTFFHPISTLLAQYASLTEFHQSCDILKQELMALKVSNKDYFTYFCFLLDEGLHQYDTLGLMRIHTHESFGTGTQQGEAMDTFPYYDNDPRLSIHQQLTKLLQECKVKGLTSYNPNFKSLRTGKVLMESSREAQLNLVYCIIYRLAWYKVRFVDGYSSWLYELLKQVMKKKLPYETTDLIWIAQRIPQLFPNIWHFPFLYFAKYALADVKENGGNQTLTATLKQLLQEAPLNTRHSNKDTEKIKNRIQEVIDLGSGAVEITPVWLNEKDQHFGEVINRWIKNLAPDQQNLWFVLLKQLGKASAGKPSAKFMSDSEKHIQAIGLATFSKQVKAWLGNSLKIGSDNFDNWNAAHEYNLNAHYQKGMIWASLLVADDELLQLLAALAERAYHRVSGYGPLAAAVGNAAIYVLGNASGLVGVGYLSRLKLKIRQSNTRTLISNYLNESAKRLGISPAEIEDMATPDFGLVDGLLSQKLGEYTAILQIEGIGKTSLTWENKQGKRLKSVPAPIKTEHPQALKALRAKAKEIQKTLTTQRDRLDRSFVEERAWTWQQFEEYVFNHGLMSFLAKQLIWQFEIAGQNHVGIWNGNSFITADHQEINLALEQSTIKLWHPILSNVDEVLAWRNYLEEREIQQPLKQAYREVYLVTDAELNTTTYSNRFAAHLLKQYQFNTLAKLRGWRYSLMGAYDDGVEHTIASISLPAHNLSAEFWIDEMGNDHDFSESGIWLYVATDQVRFNRNGAAMRVEEVPKMVFSEIMRDVDLFVGVASIGNDPNWADHGEDRRRLTYWENYSFGELTESAKTRKLALERLIPRLKIADKCSFEQRFLVVEGSFRTYKIHLGSGNILMKPNDEYLCIVPQRKEKSTGKVFLPFEGDKVLSIILSKAMMLADDTNIEDSTILSQIHRR